MEAKCATKRLFTGLDYHLVRLYVSQLSDDMEFAVRARFWENLSIEEIARVLKIDWDEVEVLLNRALRQLKNFCELDLRFSRTNQDNRTFNKIAV